ncbi:hypothetical protein H0I76_02950 [Limibaculum sp. M0105]|uniref:Flagellar assembly protein FliH/Type III secretion system HrpE domain-containing protein n=1 Tax=Thermohalobaculum xanthum TaxID=2753746 RepID=A0A8J7M4F6_9RHOB|nr:hypothetical protein [Thermohalobaculum xanthum]MBK0398136.1 hypothetical protein [Thermohalobaculum xanthum]
MRFEQFVERGAFARSRPPSSEAAPATEANISIPSDAPVGAEDTSADNETATAAIHDDAEARADALCAALAGALDDLQDLIGKMTQGWAHALGEAAQHSVPCLAEIGFGAEVSEAALTIARLSQQPRIRMTMAPAHHEAIATRIAGHAGADLITIVADPKMVEGRVELDWEDGGAVIDRDRLERAAREVLTRHLASLEEKDTRDERF